MKNIHVLPTNKPSRVIYSTKYNKFMFCYEKPFFLDDNQAQHKNIHITNNEKIKGKDWFYCPTTNIVNQCESDYHSKKLVEPKRFKIILTTDSDLIKDGVQAIDDDFLEWFVKNPSCDKVEVVEELNMNGKNGLDRARFIYKIIIPKNYCDNCNNDVCCCIIREQLKQETLEQRVEAFSKRHSLQTTLIALANVGAEWQAERMYSEVFEWLSSNDYLSDSVDVIQKQFEQFKKKQL